MVLPGVLQAVQHVLSSEQGSDREDIQGDTSRLSKPPVDIDLKIVF